MKEDEFRNLPSVDKLLADVRIKEFLDGYPQGLITDIIRTQLKRQRDYIKKGKQAPVFDDMVDSIVLELKTFLESSLKPVINATGVILHTNLGRAPLSRETIDAMSLASGGYCNLEFDIESGARGSRHIHVERLLCQLTGAESALVVNNNASAVLLTLTALTKKKDVIVSRGEAVEIGGGFRIPDVMRQSGAKLVEVGTTNCTYVRDYEDSINDRTAALLRVHPSNFSLTGFTSRVSPEELAVLAKKHNILSIDDQGSGCFLDTVPFGLSPEPTVQQSLEAGISIICFSGDKLVGGPQAGIIVGRKDLIDKLKKHPLARTVRIDKTRLAGIAATIRHYLKGEALEKVPVWHMISMPLEIIAKRATKWSEIMDGEAMVVDGESMVGGGSLPGNTLPTKLLSIDVKRGRKEQNIAHLLSSKLRRHVPPVIARIEKDAIFLDPRTVLPNEDEIVAQALAEIAGFLKSNR